VHPGSGAQTVPIKFLSILAFAMMQLYFSCMGHMVRSCRRAVPAMDVDDVRCLHVPVRQACSVCVSGSAAWVLKGWNLEVCSSLCPWGNL